MLYTNYKTIVIGRIVLLLLLGMKLHGQVHSKIEMKSEKMQRMAEYFFNTGDYYAGIDLYLKAIQKEPKKPFITERLATAYEVIRDYRNAMKWYKKTMELNPGLYPLSKFKYGQMLKMNGKYHEAKAVFLSLQSSYTGPTVSAYKKWIKAEIDGCDLALDAMNNPEPIEIEHLNSNVNAAYNDFAPVKFEGNLLYSSLPLDSLLTFNRGKGSGFYTQLYLSKKNGGGWEKGKRFTQAPFNVKDQHTANGSFSPDMKRFYFTRCELNQKGNMICAIFVSHKIAKRWDEPVKLDEVINNPVFTSTQPAIGLDPRGKEVLYFVSDRGKGIRSYDIWFAELKEDKERYKIPKKLSKTINTQGDEMTPFYDFENRTLYFSSTGHPGFGGYDIFKTSPFDRNWGIPENLGAPVNSSTDDLYYILDNSPDTGYFVSNRPGSITIKGETCCDDIYRFYPTPIKLKLAIEGWVLDKKDSTHTSISTANIELYKIEDSTKQTILSVSFPEDKMYFFELEPDCNYVIVASAKYYSKRDSTFNTVGVLRSDTLRLDLFLARLDTQLTSSTGDIKSVGSKILKEAIVSDTKSIKEQFSTLEGEKNIVLKNVYFEFDKASLKEKSKKNLDELYGFMVEYPEMIIELSAHTDSKGSDTYNMVLSQKRAETVVSYLVEKGIVNKRLVAKGYGETKPIALNTLPDGTDNPKGRQLNRRIEIKALSGV
ncbi:MAG: hypothetical protein COC01_04875 [Bacteroidetes bacterium]|nr:OmpA family protein [Sphingobacteriaceae bacterium AH-315-L07]PCH67905.1 MAG: hypothetical protein COC01_04875 [Bacteroidota bacterium]